MAKKTLYQTLRVSMTAEAEVIKAAYEARMAALKDGASPEIAAERTIMREAYELLADPVRRKLYDEKLREQFRALSSGGIEESRPRPANALPPRAAEVPASSPLGWMSGIALLVVVAMIGAWVWLDHKRKTEALRLQVVRQAEEARLREEQERLRREAADWARQRSDAAFQAAEQRRDEQQRLRERQLSISEAQRQAQLQLAEQRRLEAERRKAEIQRQRQEQEDLRRSQQQLERDRRLLQELERNRGMSIPGR